MQYKKKLKYDPPCELVNMALQYRRLILCCGHTSAMKFCYALNIQYPLNPSNLCEIQKLGHMLEDMNGT